MQQAVVLIKDIKEAWLSSQREDIKDKLGAVFKARGKTAKDKADKVDKTKLPELLAEEVTKIGLSAISTLLKPVAAIPKLDLKVINLLDKLLFTAWRTSKPISSIKADIKSNNLSNSNKDNKRTAYYISSDPQNSVTPRTRLPHQIGHTTLEAIYTQPN